MSFPTLPFANITDHKAMAIMETIITKISPVGKPNIVFLFFTDFLPATSTPHHITSQNEERDKIS